MPVLVNFGQTNNASTPIFFTGYPVLRKKRIKAIAINPVGSPGSTNPSAPYYLTLVNGNGEQLLYNYPMTDLMQTDGGSGNPLSRLRLFDLYDIDLLNSYWINQNNISWVISGSIMYLNFYY
jgi:hypothetical protein